MASLFVYMNGYEVGEYIQHRGGAQEFIYSDSWQCADYSILVSLERRSFAYFSFAVERKVGRQTGETTPFQLP